MIACAAAAPPRGERMPRSFLMPISTLTIGRLTPMRPVEQTSTWLSAHPSRRATAQVMARAWIRPSLPVQAFAFPLLTMIARALPVFAFRMLTFTGAAFTWFFVNVAAQTAGFSEAMSAMSFLPRALIPAAKPAARNPRGAVTEPLIRVKEVFMGAVPPFLHNRKPDSGIAPPGRPRPWSGCRSR